MISRCNPRCSNRGFTLIELTVTMLIIAVAMSIATVKLTSKMPGTVLKSAARMLSADLRYASVLASAKGKDIKLTVDLDSLSYTLNGKTRGFPENTRIVITDPEDGKLRRGRWNVIFYACGGSTGGEINLSLGKKTFRVTIDPVAGAVLTQH
ncbi:MAG: prepilin-type N-terminal cleavage/methylation domain-containing protein [Nitrospirae bacterium]|nr:prepilin-type N-terminal cleavage/methylation domain-containing protein [Nitrospirota bacterium]